MVYHVCQVIFHWFGPETGRRIGSEYTNSLEPLLLFALGILAETDTVGENLLDQPRRNCLVSGCSRQIFQLPGISRQIVQIDNSPLLGIEYELPAAGANHHRRGQFGKHGVMMRAGFRTQQRRKR